MTLNSNENLLETILSKENLNAAWKHVRSNKGAAGIDEITVDNFMQHFKAVGDDLIETIRQGHYQPLPVRRVYIRKPDGGQRGLGIPTIFDRVIQQAIAQIIGPSFDKTFSEFSYGFRPKRSQHHAVKKLQKYIEGGKRIAVDVDLSKFFDRVNHDFLMSLLGQRISDKRLLKLIASYLRVGSVEDGCWKACHEGVPQGGPLSPLLSNIVLDLLDKELEKRQHDFVRYADDFVIVVSSKRAGERLMASIKRFVERKLKLKVNDAKSQVAPVSRCKFLGFSFRGAKLVWHDKSLRQFKYHVRQITGRSRGISMEKKLKELTVYLRGWINYFGIAQGYQKCIDLDCWIRRRLRMSYWKNWRRVRTKVRNLLRMGVSESLAVTCGSTGKSYWRSAKTEGIHIALNNEFFEEMGLISLRDRWVEIHYG
ncbi:group II intron reverse transcriptase/maturase [Microbulbifer sp. THAF38]|uniref:group II intron reverse transcriptase/maturase n=1 Tax=Microbulbifer sp. THAF38 TaxID=2587856 RepID=UPI0012685A06|nr:group II intron reverse transcriptase/maturase [Microbulbifer sp. THAF38]QFT54039.1 Group II intron-encoded protein LtrA [Microbulbifer sp. THAF38]QFT54439.1 Group II intron-encoded protein LtrA [Microbulbifer sp. THAF38]QFT55221.1 Group II intron-encoded protein LtrA [Microbulbifer sp. THAF38]QFT55294.1 Group II intron-encoded protein LtrA [Microbulbifer sp. THAF38]QFT55297.1 Group II intron-encoded protein LtrA [Microbulbifer sp. THAF38]